MTAASAGEGEVPHVRLGAPEGGVATMTLCRPKKLNSLSLSMIQDLRGKYASLGPAGARCVILRGEGRALCAGGDVAEVYEGVLTGTRYPADFFYDEYQLDYLIATLHEHDQVLQVALWDGIVMGGGVGISVHSPIRIATENTMFAMPETGIGLFPDVGATWLLSRLQAGMPIGLYLGVTGQRIGAADCLHSGLATHYCPSAQLEDAVAGIRALGERANNLEAVSAAIVAAGGAAAIDTSKAVLLPNAEAINRCFKSHSTAEDIVHCLEAEESEWAAKTLRLLRQMSPTSVKLTLEAIYRHESVSLRDALAAEYRMAQWCMRPQPHSDFCEGIRALLIDKDKKFGWTPDRLEDVTKERVDGFFAPLKPDHPRGELQL